MDLTQVRFCAVSAGALAGRMRRAWDDLGAPEEEGAEEGEWGRLWVPSLDSSRETRAPWGLPTGIQRVSGALCGPSMLALPDERCLGLTCRPASPPAPRLPLLGPCGPALCPLRAAGSSAA